MRAARPGRFAWPLLLAGCAPVVEGWWDDGGAVPSRAPNVLVVLMDDVGTDAVATYGEHPDAAPTPTLDTLAGQGVLFRNAWAAPVCSPTRAMLLTGRYGRRYHIGRAVQVRTDAWGLPLAEQTLAEVLREAPEAYATGAFGKWHLSTPSTGGLDAPGLQGFQRFFGTLGNLNAAHDPDAAAPGYRDWELVEDGVASRRTDWITTATIDAAVAFVREAPEPWFAYVPLHGAHEPFDDPPPPWSVGAEASPEARFRANVTALDAELGRLIEEMDPDVRRNTWVVVVGDNGTPNTATLPPWQSSRAKYSMFEGGLGVPLVVAGPGLDTPGREQDTPVHVVDLFTTIASLAGASVGRDVDGVDLSALLQEADATLARDVIYAESFEPNGPGVSRTIDRQAVRDRSWKLVRSAGAVALFDLRGRDLEDEWPVDLDVADGEALRAYGELLDALDARRASVAP